MTDIELDELEAKAKAASYGSWLQFYADDWYDRNITTRNRGNKGELPIAIIPSTISETNFGEEQKANSAYIAAANPAIILELIAELKQARKARDGLLILFNLMEDD